MSRQLKILLLGAPGAGKGTQATAIVEKYGVVHVSTGVMLRDAIAQKTALGLHAKKAMDAGKLVDDDTVNGIVAEKLASLVAENKGFLLDGYPRTLVQAEALEQSGQKLDIVIAIDTDDEPIVERITGRRSCPKCQRVYHIRHKQPKVEGQCDDCQDTALVTRDDDNEEVVRERLKAYYELTEPLIAYYTRQGCLVHVDGNQPIAQVRDQVLASIEKLK